MEWNESRRHGMTRNLMKWNCMTWYAMKSHEMAWNRIKDNGMTWYDIKEMSGMPWNWMNLHENEINWHENIEWHGMKLSAVKLKMTWNCAEWVKYMKWHETQVNDMKWN